VQDGGIPDNPGEIPRNEPMPIVVLGLNHRTAPVEVREKVVFDNSRLQGHLAALKAVPGVQEGLILSTCNRTELYCFVAPDAPASLRHWLSEQHGTELSLDGSLYELADDSAVEHAFAVAAGLDSMIVGEPQILGQLKDAYRAAQDAGTTGPILNRLFQQTFAVAKRVRTETRIGASAVSVASIAVQLARRIFSSLDRRTALLVGAGETIDLVARHLKTQGIGQILIANRTLSRAEELAREFGATALPLDQLPTALHRADVVITSTASPEPVIGLKAVKAALDARRRQPMLMVDIAVPRDIEPDVARLEDVYLYTIDDLRNVVSENLKARADEAAEARTLIASEVAGFRSTLKTLDAAPMIRALRVDAEQVKATTLEQARKLVASGKPPEEALAFLANTLTSRLLHAPSSSLREAAESGDSELVAAAARLFRLPPGGGTDR